MVVVIWGGVRLEADLGGSERIEVDLSIYKRIYQFRSGFINLEADLLFRSGFII
jgi:hypothetical protein